MITVDGTNLFDELGLVLEDRERALSSPQERAALGQSPEAFRRFILGHTASGERTFSLRGAITADPSLTGAAAKTQLETRLDELKFRLRPRRTAILRFTDLTGRFWELEFLQVITRGFAKDWVAFGNAARRVDIRGVAPDPRALSETETVLSDTSALPNVFDVIPIGSATQGGVLLIEGLDASPLLSGWVLEYRDELDVVLKSLTWEGQNLGTGDTVRIDLEDAIVELDTGAGFVNAVDDLKEGSDLPIIVDPNDGAADSFLDQIAAKVPDLRLSGTGSLTTFSYTYRARFL